jgi:hypothetical protein
MGQGDNRATVARLNAKIQSVMFWTFSFAKSKTDGTAVPPKKET